MPAKPISIVMFTPQPRDNESKDHEVLASARDRVRAHLRANINSTLQELTGLDDAHMSYFPIDRYARLVVIRYRYKLVGWPDDIPFCNLSDIRDGVEPLQRLFALWNAKTLKFERATRADLVNAARDPFSVHPIEQCRQQHSAPHRRASAPSAIVVYPLVLHPGNLSVLGTHPTSTQPSKAVLGKRRRRQRNDVKKARVRFVTNPDNLPPKLPRAGVKSAECVLDCDIPRYGEPRGMWQGEDWPVDDPITEFEPEPVIPGDGSFKLTTECVSDIDEIETASEGEGAGEAESEIDEF
ncbi:hypothetical protein BV20DRAFT_1050931 [Pilatotrama ljubarskyi]|nr:hypothetical protein BV20DRAFT_1050931 [Pilatotrama ljubarskyi]